MDKLREFVHRNPHLSGDTKVLVERVEDRYFEKHSWSVFKVDNEITYQCEVDNERIENDLENMRKEYPNAPEEFFTKIPEEIIEESKSQFHPAWHIGTNNENDLVFIHMHY